MRLIPSLEMSINKIPTHKGMDFSIIQTSEKYCSFLINRFIQIFTVKDLYLKSIKNDKLDFLINWNEKEKVTFVYDRKIGIRYQFSKLSYCEIDKILNKLIVDGECFSWLDVDGICFFSVSREECNMNNSELHEINIASVKTGISEYLLLDGYGEDYRNTDYYTFGIDCYGELEKLLLFGTDNENRQVDHKVFAAVYDHKRTMVFRIEYLQKHLAKDLSKYIEEYKNIVDTMNRIIRKIIKGNISRNTGQFNSCISLIDTIKKKEVKVLSELLMEL